MDPHACRVELALEAATERDDELLPQRRMRRRAERDEHPFDAAVGIARGDVQDSHATQKYRSGTSMVSPARTGSARLPPLASCGLPAPGRKMRPRFAAPFSVAPPAMAIACSTVRSPSIT